MRISTIAAFTASGLLALALPASGLLALVALGCSAEVGSKRWCEQMEEKSKGDWSTNEALDYAKHCVLSGGEE